MSAEASRMPTLLIVDDEEIIRDLCAQALSDYQVLHAGNGRDALELLRRKAVDIVLTDVMMPVMNGLELLASIKESSPNQAVVVMTGFGDKEVILKALKAGADDFIHKPINLLQLKTAIVKTLEKKTLLEELVQLKQMDRLKSDFLGLVSHKLKTPITVISLFLQNLERDPDTVNEPDFRESLKLILEESGYLSSLVHELLDFSKIILNDGTAHQEPVAPQALVNEVLLELHELADRNQIHLACRTGEHLPTLLLDRRKFLFALRAIIENALKFSPPETTVTIDLDVAADQFRIRVGDEGPGIPPEERRKVFERFYQIDPDNTGQIRGFGLGLFYARQCVYELGGSIELNGRQQQGTEVTLRLPLATATGSATDR